MNGGNGEETEKFTESDNFSGKVFTDIWPEKYLPRDLIAEVLRLD